MALKRKVYNGMFLVTVSSYFLKLLDFIVYIILARMLPPAEIGVLSLAFIFIMFLMLFHDFGLSQALIQKKQATRRTVNTVLILAPVLSFGLMLITWILSPFIETFYSSPELGAMLRMLSVSLILVSFGSVPKSLLEKELDYKKRIIPEVLGAIVMFGVSIMLALRGFGAWSMIYGYMAMFATNTICVWAVSDFKPSFEFDMEIAKRLFNYSKYVVAIYVISFTISFLSLGFIGKIFGLAILGYFTVAEKISTLVVKNIIKLINRVMFTAFSKIQDDLKVLRRSYAQLIEYAAFIIIPANCGIFILSQEIITVAIGKQWAPAAPILSVLSFMGIFMALSQISLPVFLSTNKHKLLSLILFMQFVLVLVMILPASSLGIMGIAHLVTVTYILCLLAIMLVMRTLLRINLLHLAQNLAYIPVSAAFMCVGVGVAKEFLPVNNLSGLLLMILFGGAIYFIVSFLLNKRFYKRIVREALALF